MLITGSGIQVEAIRQYVNEEKRNNGARSSVMAGIQNEILLHVIENIPGRGNRDFPPGNSQRMSAGQPQVVNLW